MEWYSKWVVMMSVSVSSAGCCTGQKSQISFSCGMTTMTAGVLAGGALDADAALGQPVLLRLA